MDNEMMNRLIAIQMKHNPQTRIGAAIVVTELLTAMREPTRAMIVEAMTQPHPSIAECGGVIQQGEAAVKIDWQAMVDCVIGD